ncbi:Hypothetical predicted protein [Podarcis lilfordi]|uniref:Uncharacterized protein n=1 Tax=Podarcis lilfordi TaxID=74358 RepID=A0AA35NV82_9SAUR|nr:Hypothetical predicted protein [Podarcis lilfordi]
MTVIKMAGHCSSLRKLPAVTVSNAASLSNLIQLYAFLSGALLSPYVALDASHLCRLLDLTPRLLAQFECCQPMYLAP